MSDGFWTQWNESTFDEGADPATMADAALQAGVDRYIALMSGMQAYLNLETVGLYHSWEQQVLEFYRRYVIEASYGDPVTDITLVKFRRAAERAVFAPSPFHHSTARRRSGFAQTR